MTYMIAGICLIAVILIGVFCDRLDEIEPQEWADPDLEKEIGYDDD